MWGLSSGWFCVIGVGFRSTFSLVLLPKSLVIEHVFEYNGSIQLGDCGGAVSADAAPLDAALDTFDHALTYLIATLESGGLDQLDATAKLAVLQRFETLRNKLPIVDHGLIANAEASDLPGSHCFST